MPDVGKTVLVPYGDATLQDVITGVENDADPIRAYFKVKTNAGNLKLKKTSEDGVVKGIKFKVTGTDYNKIATTDENGTFTLTDLVPGKYTVTAHTPTEYVEQKSKTVNVESGKTATVSFSNVLKKWNLTVKKQTLKQSLYRVMQHLQEQFTESTITASWLTSTPPIKTAVLQLHTMCAVTTGL